MAAQDIYLVPLGVALGERVPISELSELDDDQVLRYKSFGYENCRVASTDAFTLCQETVQDSAMFDAARDDVDAFVYAIEPNVNSSNNWMLNEEAWKQRDIRWLIQSLRINPARVVGLSLYNCATFLGALDLTTNLIRAGSARTCLVTIAGVANEFSPRIPHAFHVQSDGAVSFLVTTDTRYADRYQVVGQLVDYVNPAEFRDLDGTIDETRYFTLKALKIRSAVERLLRESDVRADQLDRVFLQNLGTASMTKYGKLCGVTEDKVWQASLADNAHVIGVDSLVNFHDHHTSGQDRDGLALVLGTSGMSWGATVLRYERGSAR